MPGYRTDDDWSEVTPVDKGLPGRIVIPAAAGVFVATILVALIGHFSIGRTICALFALLFLALVGVSVRAIGIGAWDDYFEARSMVVRKADQPVAYWMYFALHVLLVPLFLAIAIACAGLSYLDPWK
jgi:uncharacterized membrane protein YidH (DUF202 family)